MSKILSSPRRNSLASPIRNSFSKCLEKEDPYSYIPVSAASNSSDTSSFSDDEIISPISSPTRSSRRRKRRGRCTCALLAILGTLLLVFALIGILAIVGYAVGAMQVIRINGVKDLRSAGWNRRPIKLRASSSVDGSSENSVVVKDYESEASSKSIDELELLILCPMRNAQQDLPHFFSLLDNLSHPKSRTSLGFLVGDETDSTAQVLADLVANRTSYHKTTIIRKDFGTNLGLPDGKLRHSFWVQAARRSVMAKARTFLMTSTVDTNTDWVLWLDSDIVEYSPTIFEDLLILGNTGVASDKSRKWLKSSKDQDSWNDVIVPNAMRRNEDGSIRGYDDNNWAETSESLTLKATLSEETVLIEGNLLQHMGRQHLSQMYQPYTEDRPAVFSIDDNPTQGDQRYNTTSPSYIASSLEMDGVGGVAALVRADVHRMGGIYPAFNVDHQLETEGFGVVSKKLGARILGLSQYFVVHKS